MAKHKMAHDHFCRGPRLGLYIQRDEVDWVQVAIALGDQEKVTEAKIHAMKSTIQQQFANNADPRLGCGFRLNSLYEERPWDGQKHYVNCPKCGERQGIRHEALDEPEE
jgi:hypothetical protein